MAEKTKILLIEDNPGDARLIDIYLRESPGDGYTISVADYLSKGIKLLKENKFDAIIADLSLPDSEGLETFKKIYEHAPEVPIIVLTGFDDESIGINAMKHGAQDFLVKGKLKGKGLKRSIHYSIERYKLLKELSENAKKLKEKTDDLNREKLKLAEAQKLAHIGSWEWDLTNNILTWSDELYHIYGVQPHELTPTYEGFLEWVHPSDKGYVKEILENSYKDHKPFKFYHRIVPPDKKIRTIHSRGEVIVDEEGKVLKMFGTAQDVTERLHEEEMERLAVAATKSYNSVIIANRAGEIEWVNEGFTKLTGFTLEEVKQTHGELLRKDHQTGLSQGTDFYEQVVKEKKPVAYEGKNVTKGGKEYWVITTLTPVLSKDGEVERIIAIDTDITLRKKMEEDLLHANKIAEHSLMKGNKALDELMKAKKQLEESLKIKEQFFANMSHEIRTPMNAIIGFTELILKTPLTTEQKQYIDAVKTSGENLLVIINDILDFSKIQSGKVAFEQISFKLSQLMATVTEFMLPKSMEKNIKLSTFIDKIIPDNLVGDPTRLNQILLNLVGNSIKFTERGEVKITVSLLSQTEEEVELKFSVNDTGIGIPEDKLSSIFEEFTQATNDTTRKYGGSGLGLTIVKQLVEMQGGKVLVESKEGIGSTFSFNLKFDKSLNKPVGEKSRYPKSNGNLFAKRLNILLVEDNVLNQMLAKKVLTDWNWNVEVADNGLVAIEKLEKQNFDIVLMDIQLPEMDGYEATRYIRKKMSFPKSNVPIMAMTAHAMASEEEKCRQIGMNGYISKPFDQKVLYSRIVAIMQEHSSFEHDSGIPTQESEIIIPMKHTDLSYLKDLSNGSDKFIAEMIELFIKQTPEALDNLEKYSQNKDWKSLRAVAHKMKPSVSFVGLKEIENDVRTVEELASKEQDLERLPDLITKIVQICKEALVELDSELKRFPAN